MIILKTTRFSKKVPPTGISFIDTAITIINVATTVKDIYDYFTDNNKK